MDISRIDRNFQLCVDALAEAGINPQVYPIEQEQIQKVRPEILDKIQEVRNIAENLDCAVSIVGGFVRDLILGKPSDDVDFVVFKGDIEEFTNEIAARLKGKVAKMSNQTLTTQVRFQDNIVFEFNSTRKERYEYPSRVPIVEEATIVEDLNRRDFTINALLMFENNFVDIFEGLEHIEDGIIRTTRDPSTVFHEDYLRMFRAIRFACRLNFDISEETKKGIIKHVRNILEVPSERILSELKQSFEHNPLQAFQLMVELEIFQTMFPTIRNSKLNLDVYEVSTIFEKIEKEFRHLIDKEITEIYPYFTVFLKEIDLEILEDSDETQQMVFESKLAMEIEKILNKYKFSNKEKLSIHKYIQYSKSLKKYLDEPLSNLRVRQYIQATDPKTATMIHLFNATQNTKTSREDISELEIKIQELIKDRDLIFFNTALSGHEIAQHFKIEGHAIGKAKQLLSEAIMSEAISNTKEDCHKYLEENLEQMLKTL